MKPDKAVIKRSFSRAAETYDGGSALQSEVACDLARCLETQLHGGRPDEHMYERAGLERMLAQVRLCASVENVLDIGCGTGHLTTELKRVCPGSVIHATDIAHRMLLKLKEKRTGGRLVCSECESLPYAPSSFDLVASNLAYQWVSDLTRAFGEVAGVLRPGGLFVFTSLGPSTLNELKSSFTEACGSPEKTGLMEFRRTDEVAVAIEEAGLTLISLETLPVFKSYEDIFGLLRTLKSIGASPPVDRGRGLSVGRLLKEAGQIYSKKFPAPGGLSIIATYEVIFAAARKNP